MWWNSFWKQSRWAGYLFLPAVCLCLLCACFSFVILLFLFAFSLAEGGCYVLYCCTAAATQYAAAPCRTKILDPAEIRSFFTAAAAASQPNSRWAANTQQAAAAAARKRVREIYFQFQKKQRLFFFWCCCSLSAGTFFENLRLRTVRTTVQTVVVRRSTGGCTMHVGRRYSILPVWYCTVVDGEWFVWFAWISFKMPLIIKSREVLENI